MRVCLPSPRHPWNMWYVWAMSLSVQDRLEIEFEKRREHYYEDVSWSGDAEDDMAELDLQDDDE